jgi:hypothetical protein
MGSLVNKHVIGAGFRENGDLFTRLSTEDVEQEFPCQPVIFSCWPSTCDVSCKESLARE